MQMVLVEWVDSFFSEDGWHLREELTNIHIAHCVTCGFILREDDDQIVIVMNSSDTGNAANAIVIPRESIKKITKVDGKQ